MTGRFLHPTDVDLVQMAEHLRACEKCRRGFARIMYEPSGPVATDPLPPAGLGSSEQGTPDPAGPES